MKTFKTIFFTMMSILLLSPMGEQIVRAEILCVNPGGTGGCYDSIQAAIDASGAIDTAMQSGSDRLAALQNDDGGWDWPLDDGNPANASPTNTVGPIAMGLAQAYLRTGDSAHLTALQNAGTFLLAKINNFSPSDGYLAAMLDQVFAVTTYTDHVTTNFYDQLAAGTYDRLGLGTLYSTASYVQSIRNARAGTNLAAWDIGMGLVGAALAGASTVEWIAGVKGEIDELDSNLYWDVIGLAGAVYGLAFVGEDFDPTAGQHAAAGSLSDLSVILAGYQIDGGGFSWSSLYLNPGEGNETIQETAYAILALNEVDRNGYLIQIQGAADYMRSVQLLTGGWENYTGDPDGENNEITAEALWGHAVVYPSGGTTILVAAGTYTEAVLIEKSLTLLGATAGVNKNGYTVPPNYAWDDTVESIINHPNPSGGYTAIVDIHDVDNVTFDGFVVQELNAEANKNTSLVRVYAHTREISTINVVNNVIGPNTNTIAQDGAQGRMGLYIVNHPYDDKGVVNSRFAGNKIFDCKGNGDNVFLWTSYYAYGAPGPASMAGTVIEDNEIYGAHRSGIETAGGFSDLTILNNKIYGNSGLPTDDPDFLKYGHGIQLIRGSSDKVSDPSTAYGPVNLTIAYNEIYGNEKNGIYMGPKNESITFTGNRIHDNGWDGIMLDLEGNYWNPTFEDPPVSEQYACYDCSNNVVASYNAMYDNGTGGNPIANLGVQIKGVPTNGFIFNAKYNWWGDASGPLDPSGTNETDGAICYAPSTMRNADGTANGVSDLYVDYCPWQLYQDPDVDDDGICNPYTVDPSCEGSDNCPLTPNSGQEDNYPPGGNGMGDACECEADFDCNGSVDANDVIRFLWDTGRNQYNDPCTNSRWCYGDFDCDGAVTSNDVTKFLEDTGRNIYHKPCPVRIGSCAIEEWCNY